MSRSLIFSILIKSFAVYPTRVLIIVPNRSVAFLETNSSQVAEIHGQMAAQRQLAADLTREIEQKRISCGLAATSSSPQAFTNTGNVPSPSPIPILFNLRGHGVELTLSTEGKKTSKKMTVHWGSDLSLSHGNINIRRASSTGAASHGMKLNRGGSEEEAEPGTELILGTGGDKSKSRLNVGELGAELTLSVGGEPSKTEPESAIRNKLPFVPYHQIKLKRPR